MNKKNEEINYVPEEDSSDIEKKAGKIKSKLKKCQKEKEEYLAGWQRAKAYLINYRKEQEKRSVDYYKFANERLILEILAVLDSFVLALKHVKGEDKEGLLQIYNQLKNILKNQALEEIKAIDEKFNPEFHESVGEIKGKKEGVVIEELQKGYKLNGKVIRATKVRIGG